MESLRAQSDGVCDFGGTIFRESLFEALSRCRFQEGTSVSVEESALVLVNIDKTTLFIGYPKHPIN